MKYVCSECGEIFDEDDIVAKDLGYACWWECGIRYEQHTPCCGSKNFEEYYGELSVGENIADELPEEEEEED